jgi:hypothetical protein
MRVIWHGEFDSGVRENMEDLGRYWNVSKKVRDTIRNMARDLAMTIVHGGGVGGKTSWGGGKGRDFREILVEGWGGYPFFGQGERRNGVK